MPPCSGKGILAYLEVVRELCSASVPRVHGDEDAAVGVTLDHVPHEHQRLFVRAQGVEDRKHLYKDIWTVY